MEAVGSMGTDTPVAVLSERSRLLFDYFQQLFAQVTNPPLDAIREELVTSLASTIGAEGNLLDSQPDACHQIALPFPILDNDELAKLIHINDDGDRPEFAARVIAGFYRVAGGGAALRDALDRVRAEASAAIAEGVRIIVLSDRDSGPDLAPIPSLLLVSAVHHHLIRELKRTQVGLVLETGDARECTTWLCSSGTARARSIRTSPSSRSKTSWRKGSTGSMRWTRARPSRTTSRRPARVC